MSCQNPEPTPLTENAHREIGIVKVGADTFRRKIEAFYGKA